MHTETPQTLQRPAMIPEVRLSMVLSLHFRGYGLMNLQSTFWQIMTVIKQLNWCWLLRH